MPTLGRLSHLQFLKSEVQLLSWLKVCLRFGVVFHDLKFASENKCNGQRCGHWGLVPCQILKPFYPSLCQDCDQQRSCSVFIDFWNKVFSLVNLNHCLSKFFFFPLSFIIFGYQLPKILFKRFILRKPCEIFI